MLTDELLKELIPDIGTRLTVKENIGKFISHSTISNSEVQHIFFYRNIWLERTKQVVTIK